MNDEQKTIAGLILAIQSNQTEVLEMTAGLHNIMDRVGFREKADPICNEEKRSEPQNLTEALERLREISIIMRNEVSDFQKRLDKTF
jgi:hypothetical protein